MRRTVMFECTTKPPAISPKAPMHLALLFSYSLLCCQTSAFQPASNGILSQPFSPATFTGACSATSRLSTRTLLSALSPRQLQFWEDVDDGLVDIEKFYASKGQSMERIRTFCRRYVGANFLFQCFAAAT